MKKIPLWMGLLSTQCEVRFVLFHSHKIGDLEMMPANSELCKTKALNMKARFKEVTPGPIILIVDDDPDFLSLVSQQISQISGSQIEVAEDCEQAVNRLTRRHFNLVICDWALATRTGPEVFSLADPLLIPGLEPTAKTPVLFMSGSEKVASMQGMRSFENFEAVAFIIKNLGARMIRIMAENVLARFHESQDVQARRAYLS